MKTHAFYHLLLFVAAAVLLSAGPAGAARSSAQIPGEEPPQAGSPVMEMAAVNARISFQGMLRENGEPVTGARDMVFKLYPDAACAGAAKQTITKSAVLVSGGLFDVLLDVNAAIFNGQALYLSVTVGATALGCQEITAAPYALSLRPGAIMTDGITQASVNHDGSGLYGQANAGSGLPVRSAVLGEITGAGLGIGVHGRSPGSVGVQGYGLFGVRGVSTESTSAIGVVGAGYAGGTGVYAASDTGVAGKFITDSSTANPTVLISENSTGFARLALSNTATSKQWHIAGSPNETNSQSLLNVWYGSASGGKNILQVRGSGGADLVGNLAIRRYSDNATLVSLGEGLDYAEGFNVSMEGELPEGTVLVIDPDHPGELMQSVSAYDHKVAGIIAGAKGLESGIRLGASGFDYNVALAGRVYACVDGRYSAVEPGDLLTTSDTPGCAMKAANPARATGAVLGKAMEPLAKDAQGLILVLVSLQ